MKNFAIKAITIASLVALLAVSCDAALKDNNNIGFNYLVNEELPSGSYKTIINDSIYILTVKDKTNLTSIERDVTLNRYEKNPITGIYNEKPFNELRPLSRQYFKD